MSKEKESNSWMQQLWRPMMGWMYMLICLLDMAVFPVCWSLLQALTHQPITQWNPLTLQGAGLFHIAMGAVLGIAAFGRTQEKLAGTAANPTATTTITQNTTPSFGGQPSGGFGNNNSSFGGAPAFSAPSAGFGAPTGGFGSPAPASSGFGSAPAGGFGGGGFGGASSTPALTASGKKIVPTDPDPVL